VTPLLAACRPRQWIKNGLVFLPLISSGSVGSPEAVRRSAIAAAAFILMSSAVYLVNDLADRGADAGHPVKKRRPIPSGKLSRGTAASAALVLGVGSLLIALTLPGAVWSVLGFYAVSNIGYSAGLRQQPILDVLMVSSGFVLRPVAGAWAIPVRVSAWLFVVSLLMSLTFALLKRRAELTGLEERAGDHRPALGGYSVRFLDQLVAITAGAGIMSYALYTFQSEHSDSLVATLPLFLYGVFRYLYLVYERGAGAAPEEIFLRDRPLQIAVVLYAATLAVVVKWFSSQP
jgi:4-hydroxybenzoate polyprenyltransferase